MARTRPCLANSRQKSLPFGRLFCYQASGVAETRSPSCLLVGRCAGAAGGQLLEIILEQADFYTATAHALRLLAIFGGGCRRGSVAHAENVNPVNRDFVVLDQ